MPQAAIPAALPYVLGGLGIAQAVQANVANKATIKNAENASANAQRQIGQNADTAFSRLGQYNQANPGIHTNPGAPAYSATNIPLVGGQHVGGMGGSALGMGQPSGMMGGGMQSPNGMQGGDQHAALVGAIGAMTPEQIQSLIHGLGGGGGAGMGMR